MERRNAKLKCRMASISIACCYGAWAWECGWRIARGYRLDSQSIFSLSGRPLFTTHMSITGKVERGDASLPSSMEGHQCHLTANELAEEHAVGKDQQSVTRFDPIASMRISVRPRSGLERNDGVKSHSSHTSLIEVLAARYPVIRRLVGELSFRIVARRFILSEPSSIAISPSYGDNFP